MAEFTLKITRGNPEAGQEAISYTVPYADGMSLLDAVLWVQEHQDESVVVRYSCHAGKCKECIANVDGRPKYLCMTKASPDSTVELSPLSARPWIRDLVTEFD